MSEIDACYTCAQPGEWGPYHAMIPGPETGRDRWGPTRDRSKDKTLCGVSLTPMWERDRVEPHRIECKRCKAILKRQGKLDPHSRLLPKALRDELTPVPDEWPDDPTVLARYTAPFNAWEWYLIWGEKEENGDWYLFGFVRGFDDELGPWMLSEMEDAVGPFGTRVTRDKAFSPKPLSEVWDEWKGGRR